MLYFLPYRSIGNFGIPSIQPPWSRSRPDRLTCMLSNCTTASTSTNYPAVFDAEFYVLNSVAFFSSGLITVTLLRCQCVCILRRVKTWSALRSFQHLSLPRMCSRVYETENLDRCCFFGCTSSILPQNPCYIFTIGNLLPAVHNPDVEGSGCSVWHQPNFFRLWRLAVFSTLIYTTYSPPTPTAQTSSLQTLLPIKFANQFYFYLQFLALHEFLLLRQHETAH